MKTKIKNTNITSYSLCPPETQFHHSIVNDTPPFIDKEHFINVFINGTMACDVSTNIVAHLLTSLHDEINYLRTVVEQQDVVNRKSDTGLYAAAEPTLLEIQSISAILGATYIREWVIIICEMKNKLAGTTMTRALISTFLDICDETLLQAEKLHVSMSEMSG